MTTYTAELTRIAGDVDALGIAANETAIALVVAWARSAGIDPVLLSVLSDTAEPEVARARAFGMVATDLAASADEHPRQLVAVAG